MKLFSGSLRCAVTLALGAITLAQIPSAANADDEIATPTPAATAAAQAVGRPNFVLIIADDQRFDMMGQFMPKTQELLFDRGVVFDKAYITTPACCPSRASMYTGYYASRHGVQLNSSRLMLSTVFDALHDSGYYTGLIGKYLNTWSGAPRREFNYWSAFRAGSVNYINPRMNKNGIWSERKGYITSLIGDDAIEFLGSAEQSGQPFFLVFAPNAPHAPATPAKEDGLLYDQLPRYRPPSFGLTWLAHKPSWVQGQKKKVWPSQVRRIDNFRLKQLRSLHPLDAQIDRIYTELSNRGLLESTIILYISDNGMMWGEHGLESKDCAYEPAVHVPFAVHAPWLFGAHRNEGRLVANIDIAPTLYDLSQIGVPGGLDGRTLTPLLRQDPVEWRSDILIEGFRRGGARKPFKALHNGEVVYILNESSEDELYDLREDPYQLNNLAHQPVAAPLHQEFSRRLTEVLHGLGLDEPFNFGKKARASTRVRTRVRKVPELG